MSCEPRVESRDGQQRTSTGEIASTCSDNRSGQVDEKALTDITLAQKGVRRVSSI